MGNMKKSTISDSIDLLETLGSTSNTVAISNTHHSNTKEDLIAKLEKHKEDTLEHLKNIKNTIKVLKKIPYSKGDMAFHKTFGACIVQEIVLGEGVYGHVISESSEVRIRVAHGYGGTHVRLDELVPRNDLTESIYGK